MDDFINDFDFMNDFINNYNSSLIDFCVTNTISQLLFRLNNAKKIVDYWNKYQSDRKLENSMNSSESAPFIAPLLKSFTSSKLDEEQEKRLNILAEFSQKLLDSVYNNFDFIEALSDKLYEIEYSPEDLSSRCNLVSSIIALQNFIPNNQDADYVKNWGILKNTISDRLEELSSEDYEIIYSSLNPNSFFSDKSLESANIKQIENMNLEYFCKFLIYTQDGMRGNLNSIQNITTSKIKSFTLSNPTFFNEFNRNVCSFIFSEDDINTINSLTDSPLFFDILTLRNTIYDTKNENSKNDIKVYLNVLRNANDLQFAYFLYNNLNSSIFYSRSIDENSEEMKIIKERLLSLDLDTFIAIANHLKLSNPTIISEAIKLRGFDGYNNLPENSSRSDSINNLFKSISSSYCNISYFMFNPLKTAFYANDADSEDLLLKSFQDSVEHSNFNTNILEKLIYISELDDNNFVKFVIQYNKLNPMNDDEFEYSNNDYSSPDYYIKKANNFIKSYIQKRIISLPKELRTVLLRDSLNSPGELTSTILLSNISIKNKHIPSNPDTPSTTGEFPSFSDGTDDAFTH